MGDEKMIIYTRPPPFNVLFPLREKGMMLSGRLRELFDRPFKVVFPSSAHILAWGKGRYVQACGHSAKKKGGAVESFVIAKKGWPVDNNKAYSLH